MFLECTRLSDDRILSAGAGNRAKMGELCIPLGTMAWFWAFFAQELLQDHKAGEANPLPIHTSGGDAHGTGTSQKSSCKLLGHVLTNSVGQRCAYRAGPRGRLCFLGLKITERDELIIICTSAILKDRFTL